MIISVCGASYADEETLELAYQLGKRIGDKGHSLMNGGYGGTMEAAARGCSEVGGIVIGVCVSGSKVDNMSTPNKFNTIVKNHSDYGNRVSEILSGDRIVILPGKIGTLEELLRAWVRASIEDRDIPIYILGEKHRRLVRYLIDNDYLHDGNERHIQFVNSIEELDFLR